MAALPRIENWPIGVNERYRDLSTVTFGRADVFGPDHYLLNAIRYSVLLTVLGLPSRRQIGSTGCPGRTRVTETTPAALCSTRLSVTRRVNVPPTSTANS